MLYLLAALGGAGCLALGFIIGRRMRPENRTTIPAPDRDSFAESALYQRLHLAESQRDRYQKQAIDLQLATNGLLAEREELFRELRRRAN